MNVKDLSKRVVKIRLDRGNIIRLQKLSKDEAIPLSMIVDQMLVQYLGNRVTFGMTEYIPIRKVLLTKLLGKFSEKEVIEIAKSVAKQSTRKIIQRLRHDYHIMSSVGVVDALIRISNHKYNHNVNYGIHRFTISHELGRKWSLYLYEIYSSVLRQFRFKKIDITLTDRQLIFTVVIRSVL